MKIIWFKKNSGHQNFGLKQVLGLKNFGSEKFWVQIWFENYSLFTKLNTLTKKMWELFLVIEFAQMSTGQLSPVQMLPRQNSFSVRSELVRIFLKMSFNPRPVNWWLREGTLSLFAHTHT